MGYNSEVPQDRATAQLTIVGGSLVTLAGVISMIFVDMSTGDVRGISLWIILPFVTLFGLFILGNGIRTWRRNDPSKTPAADVPSRGPE